MSDYRKFKKLRVNLETVFAFKICPSLSSGHNHSIYFYSKEQKNGDNYFYVSYDSPKEDKEFEEATKFLDEYFDVKTEAESKILP